MATKKKTPIVIPENSSEHRVSKTLQKKKQFLDAFEKSMSNISAACRESGISRDEFYRWRDTDADFKMRLEHSYEATIDFAETSLFRQIRDGNTSATIFFLKTKGRHRGYQEKVVSVNVDVKQGIEALTEDELDKIIAGAGIGAMQTPYGSTVVESTQEEITPATLALKNKNKKN
jgi:hypothetical protein